MRGTCSNDSSWSTASPPLDDKNLLFMLTQKFANIDLHPDAVPNETMGVVFEELIRTFAEASNETAGEHFTPLEVFQLIVHCLFAGDDKTLAKPGAVRSLYDPVAGTGGILSVGLEQRVARPVAHLRVARPVSGLDRSVEMYCAGLGFAILGTFRDHNGFDGTMVGEPSAAVHFEFTVCRAHPVELSPTPEDLVVFYLPESFKWAERCSLVVAASFKEVQPFKPYWSRSGRTFEDPDGYRVVLQNAAWSTQGGQLVFEPAGTTPLHRAEVPKAASRSLAERSRRTLGPFRSHYRTRKLTSLFVVATVI